MSDTLPSESPDFDPAPGDPSVHEHLDLNTSVDMSSVDRRGFLRIASVGTSALLAAGCASVPAMTPVPGMTNRKKPSGGDVGHVVVIGAGSWGGWTAYHLRQRGVRVTLIDQYGAANSRSTSGDETRGVRSSYGDRTSVALWSKWARSAIVRWNEFDREWAPVFRTRFFMTTGDVIMRAADEPFLKLTREEWKKNNVPHEVIDGAECRKRWPVIKADDITIAITEPDAGVVRARASTLAVAAIGQKMGSQFIVGRVRLGPVQNGKMDGVILDDGTVIRGDAYVFACGPWLRKLFPDIVTNRMRVPLGYVCYYGTPIGDQRFTYPNLPSFNFPGVTVGRRFRWIAEAFVCVGQLQLRRLLVRQVRPLQRRLLIRRLLVARETRVETRRAIQLAALPAIPQEQAVVRTLRATAPAAPVDPAQQDPDTSSRWASQERLDGTRRFLEQRFPLLANAPLLETRACHYESSVNRDFIIDRLPNASNAWIAGVGQAEGFKFGPVVGEYIAQRVMGIDGDPALIKAFKIPKEEYDPPTPTTPGREEDDL